MYHAHDETGVETGWGSEKQCHQINLSMACHVEGYLWNVYICNGYYVIEWRIARVVSFRISRTEGFFRSSSRVFPSALLLQGGNTAPWSPWVNYDCMPTHSSSKPLSTLSMNHTCLSTKTRRLLLCHRCSKLTEWPFCSFANNQA